MANPVKSFVCAGCTLLCDDLEFQKTENGITSNSDCPLIAPWLQRCDTPFSCSVNGVKTEFDFAVEKAIELLRLSDYPLVSGLDGLSVQFRFWPPLLLPGLEPLSIPPLGRAVMPRFAPSN